MNTIGATCLLVLASITAHAQWPAPHPDTHWMPPSGMPGAMSNQLSIETSASADGYFLIIATPDGDPASVEVNISGNTVTVRRITGSSPPTHRSESFTGPGSRGYSYSYSSGSSQTTRRLSLPPDADPRAAVREDRENAVVIFVPRQQPTG